jgi:hypothetical protein
MQTDRRKVKEEKGKSQSRRNIQGGGPKVTGQSLIANNF